MSSEEVHTYVTFLYEYHACRRELSELAAVTASAVLQEHSVAGSTDTGSHLENIREIAMQFERHLRTRRNDPGTFRRILHAHLAAEFRIQLIHVLYGQSRESKEGHAAFQRSVVSFRCASSEDVALSRVARECLAMEELRLFDARFSPRLEYLDPHPDTASILSDACSLAPFPSLVLLLESYPNGHLGVASERMNTRRVVNGHATIAWVVLDFLEETFAVRSRLRQRLDGSDGTLRSHATNAPLRTIWPDFGSRVDTAVISEIAIHHAKNTTWQAQRDAWEGKGN